MDMTPLQEPRVASIRVDAVATVREPTYGGVNFLFLEYRVDPEGIVAVTTWLEPRYLNSWSAFNPVGAKMVVGGDDDYLIYLLRNEPVRLEEPEQRHHAGIGGNMNGTEDILLTDDEFRAALLKGPDVEILYGMARTQESGCTPLLPIPRADSRERMLEICYEDQRLARVSYFDAQQEPLKRVAYRYGEGGSGPLTAMEVQLYPSKLTIRTNVQASMNQGDVAEFDTVETTRHQGGRTVTVAFDQVADDGETYTLPRHIEVRNTKSGEFLRAKKVTRYAVASGVGWPTGDGPELEGGLSEIEDRLHTLTSKYYLKNPDELSAEAREEVQDLLDRLLDDPDLIPGPLFRWLYRCTVLAHTVGDADTARNLFGQYLDESERLGLPRLIAHGGKSFLRMLLRWNKHALYEECLEVWRTRVLAELPTDVMAEFIRDCPRNGDSWFAIELYNPEWLDAVADNDDKLALLYFWSQSLHLFQSPMMPADHLESWGHQPPAHMRAHLDLEGIDSDLTRRAQELLDKIPESAESEAVRFIRQHFRNVSQ